MLPKEVLNPRIGHSSHLWAGGRSSLLSLVVAAAKRPDLRPLLCMGSGMAGQFLTFLPVLGIRIRRIRFVLGWHGSGSISQRYGSGSGSFPFLINNACKIKCLASLKSLKKEVGSGVGSGSICQRCGSGAGSAPKCHGFPTLLPTSK
jgi:hypothetical protein